MAQSTIKSTIEKATLATGATLYRIGSLRILTLTNYVGANSSLTVPSADRSSTDISAPIWRTDSANRSTAVGVMVIYHDTGYVQRFYGGSYNASGSGASNIGATDRSSGVAVWSV